MPRIRTLKPEHKQHRKVGTLTHRQYRLWVGMLTEADDDGRLVADAAQLRATVFAYHPAVQVRHVCDDLDVLASVGLIRLYRVGQVVYGDFPSWRDHQKLDRAHYLASKLPSYNNSTTESLPGVSPEAQGSQGTEGNLTTREPNYSGKGVVQREPGRLALDSPANGHHGPVSTEPASGAAASLEIPPPIARALDRMPFLGPRLRDPRWWLSELRAHPQLDLAAEALKAEAWCRSNPGRAPKKQYPRFMHAWFDREERG